MPRFTALTLVILLLVVNFNSFGHSARSLHYNTSGSIGLKAKFVGEIVGYSYIKIIVESVGDSKSYRSGQIPFKGSCYEAISGNKYKIMGIYNTNTLVWKFDCFNQKNVHLSVFVGKENQDGGIDGTWSNKKISRNFYLKKSNN